MATVISGKKLMLKDKTIPLDELARFGRVENLDQQVAALVEQQKAVWEVAAKNFKALERAETKTVDFGKFQIRLQCNAERIRSSAAKTDAKSIAARPCFLCRENLPAEQNGILIQQKFLALVNPFPIFPRHLTISSLEHVPQRIMPHFSQMLEIAAALPGFTVFYNGPESGASAPDHFHFQAVGKGELPVENEMNRIEHSEILFENVNLQISSFENIRRFVCFHSPDKVMLVRVFNFLYNSLETGNGYEPMMNVLCGYSGNDWKVVVFPRENQRPSCFYKTGEEQIIVGPASVEMAGVLVLPRKEDFEKITKDQIARIFDEVTIGEKRFETLKSKLKNPFPIKNEK